MKGEEKPKGVNYTPEGEKQSGYLNSLYGGNYTFSAEPRIPDGDEIVFWDKYGHEIWFYDSEKIGNYCC